MRNSVLAGMALLVSASLLHAADVPRPAPNAVFQTTTGTPIDLAKHRGKVVALEFLLTTCPACQECSQLLERMQREYGPRGFQALGVATNPMAHMLVPDYIKKFGLSYPVGFAPREAAHEFLQIPVMLVMYVPQLVFIDREGVIRAQYGGRDSFFDDKEKNMRAQIEALLGGGSRPGARGSKKSGP